MFRYPFFRAFCLFAASGGFAAGAVAVEPEVGRYKGVLKVTRMVLGQQIVESAKAIGYVHPDGTMSLLVLKGANPFPDEFPLPLTLTLNAEGKWIIPRPAAPNRNFQSVPPNIPMPEHHGEMRVVRNRIEITYDDVPDRYVHEDGSAATVNFFSAQMPSAQFSITLAKTR